MARVSRRRFLTEAARWAGGLALLSLGGGKEERNQVFKIEFDGDESSLTYDEVSQLALRLDEVYDSLPKFDLEPTEENLHRAAIEIIPQFEYEEIVPMSQIPNIIEFHFFPDGNSANHVLGRSNCSTYVFVNGRVTSLVSAWYDKGWIFTLAHELAHVAQGDLVCGANERSLVENSAQIGAIEVCCGLANQGSGYFLYAVLDELRGMAITASLGLALRENRFHEFQTFREKLSPGAVSEAKFQKSRRRWSDDTGRLMEIIDWYNVTPLNMIAKAIVANGSEIEGLAFPPVYREDLDDTMRSLRVKTIKLDDTAYFLAHLEELAGEMGKKK